MPGRREDTRHEGREGREDRPQRKAVPVQPAEASHLPANSPQCHLQACIPFQKTGCKTGCEESLQASREKNKAQEKSGIKPHPQGQGSAGFAFWATRGEEASGLAATILKEQFPTMLWSHTTRPTREQNQDPPDVYLPHPFFLDGYWKTCA